MNINDSLIKALGKITKKVNQDFTFISKHHNEYRIRTYKLDGSYTLEYMRYNCIKERWEYLNGCNLFGTKESLFNGIKGNIIYLYNNL